MFNVLFQLGHNSLIELLSNLRYMIKARHIDDVRLMMTENMKHCHLQCPGQEFQGDGHNFS